MDSAQAAWLRCDPVPSPSFAASIRFLVCQQRRLAGLLLHRVEVSVNAAIGQKTDAGSHVCFSLAPIFIPVTQLTSVPAIRLSSIPCSRLDAHPATPDMHPSRPLSVNARHHHRTLTPPARQHLSSRTLCVIALLRAQLQCVRGSLGRSHEAALDFTPDAQTYDASPTCVMLREADMWCAVHVG